MAKFCRAELNGGLNQHFFFGNAGNECSFKSLGLFALTGPGFIAGGVLVLRGTLCASGLGRRNFTATDFCGSESKLFDELDGHFFCIATDGVIFLRSSTFLALSASRRSKKLVSIEISI